MTLSPSLRTSATFWDPFVGQLGYMHQSVSPREHLYECPEVHDLPDCPEVYLSYLHLLGYALYYLNGLLNCLVVGGCDIYLTAVLYIYLYTCLLYNALYDLSARPMTSLTLSGFTCIVMIRGAYMEMFVLGWVMHFAISDNMWSLPSWPVQGP